MNKKANHNSIIFLTTLSVYLGLVLVGGTAPVLAHSAMTRGFDIKNEIVFEDDLDKKPDDEEIKYLVGSIEEYFKKLEDFIQDLQKLHSIEKFDLDYDKFKVESQRFVPCHWEGIEIEDIPSTKRINNRWLEPAITDAIYSFNNIISTDCLSSNRFGKHKATSSGLNISYDKSELIFKVFGDKENSKDAEQLAGKFNQAAKLYEIGEENLIVKELYSKTAYSFENNQVFIVTRLPRGSIDALLAEKDAQ